MGHTPTKQTEASRNSWLLPDLAQLGLRMGHLLQVSFCTTEMYPGPPLVSKLYFRIMKCSCQFLHTENVINFSIPHDPGWWLRLPSQHRNTCPCCIEELHHEFSYISEEVFLSGVGDMRPDSHSSLLRSNV